MTTNSFTLLRLSGNGVPPYAARGLTQTLSPVALSEQSRRTINGELRDVSDPIFRKFASTISATDVDPPAMEAQWPGTILVVDCVAELAKLGVFEEPTDDPTEAPFERDYVLGSVRVADGWTFYRPRLTMMVLDYSPSYDEYNRQVQWTLNLEEV